MLQILPMIFAIMVMASTVSACWIEGYVFCKGDGLPLEGVTVSGYKCDPKSSYDWVDKLDVTNEDGFYRIHINAYPWQGIILEFTIDGVTLTTECLVLPWGIDPEAIDYEVIHVDPIGLDAYCGGPCGECKGKVSQLTLLYTGPAATVRVAQKAKKKKKGGDVSDGVVFEDDLVPGDVFTFVGTDKGTLGTEIALFIDGKLNTTIHTSCSQPIYPGLKSGLFEVVTGYSLEGGLICPLGDGCECDGGVTQLTLQYTGNSTYPIMVTGKGKKGKKDRKTGEVTFPIIFFEDGVYDVVTADGVFTIIGSGKDGKLGREILIFVGDDLNTKIHTSCSQPIGVALKFGDFEVIEGYSRDGGLLCAFE